MGYHEHIWFHQCQEDINSLYHFERIPGNIPGAYVNFCLSSSDKSWYDDLLDDGLQSNLTVCPSVLSNFKYWGTRP
jgi:hypothetical protein